VPCELAHPFDLRLPPSPAATEQFRAELRGWLRTTGASERDAFDILAATGEAIANAIEHPLDTSVSLVGLTAVTDDGLVRISVRDFGTWQDERQRPEGGYGLTLMRSLMDTVDVAQDQEGTTVVMTRRLCR
jgi:anti-sigma regulatory factor (Ser/Thr protein kinase)